MDYHMRFREKLKSSLFFKWNAKNQSNGDGNTYMMCQYLFCTIVSLKIRRAESMDMVDNWS